MLSQPQKWGKQVFGKHYHPHIQIQVQINTIYIMELIARLDERLTPLNIPMQAHHYCMGIIFSCSQCLKLIYIEII